MQRESAMLTLLLLAFAFAAPANFAAAQAIGGKSVLQYHNSATKAGYYVDAALAGLNPARTQQVAAVATPLQGQSYAQLLYVDRGSLAADLVVSATQENVVTAASAATGEVVWQKKLANPVPAADLPCGNISPFVGVLSTPVIDPASGALVVSAKTLTGSTQAYQFFALHVANGSSLPGFPVNVVTALAAQGVEFQAPAQLQRGGLLLLDGVAYAGYGGNSGDCQEYRGRVVGIKIDDPSTVYSYNTSANKGAIWAPGGPSSDGTSIFVGTGNTAGATKFSEGNAVLRLPKDLAFNGSTTEFFAPSDWLRLDDVDLDLGTAGPTVFDLPGSTPPGLVFIGGKEGIVYLMDRNNLGGFDGALSQAQVADGVIITAPAIYNSSGDTYAVIRGSGSNCPGGISGDMIGLRLVAGDPPTIETAWCANVTAQGNPAIATASAADGKATVWIVGASDGGVSTFAAGTATSGNTLNAYDGETGQLLYQSPVLGAAVSRYHTPIEAKGRVYVSTTEQIAAFTVGSGNASFAAPPSAAAAAAVTAADASAADGPPAGAAPTPAPAPQGGIPSRGLPTAPVLAALAASLAVLAASLL